MPSIDVVIPALNEERALPFVLRDVPRPPVRRIVVADNGSTDATASVAIEHGAEVVHEPELGSGGALRDAVLGYWFAAAGVIVAGIWLPLLGDRLALELNFELVDLGIRLNDLLGCFLVSLVERIDGAGDLGFGHAAHLRDQRAQALKLFVIGRYCM